MKTTAKHFQLFKAEVRKWLKVFGLTDWEVTVIHGIDNDTDGANCSGDIMSRQATIRLAIDFTEKGPIIDEDIKLAAFHEVCELLLQPLCLLAESRFGVLQESLESERHAVIMRLQHAFRKD